MKSNKQLLGEKGENLASNYLLKLSYKILFRNFRVKSGEIDIIALDGDELVFIEVRTKKNAEFGLPLETINFKKRRQIEKNARLFLSANKFFDQKNCRFDVIGVLLKSGENPEITHVVNAFLAGE